MAPAAAGDDIGGWNMQYKAKRFDLSGLKGISDETLAQHFKLYEGYVTQTNKLLERLAEFTKNGGVKNGGVDEKRMAEFSELKRRLGFEYNGMVLHEYYFGNLRKHGDRAPGRGSAFRGAAEATWGSYQRWEADFTSVGKMRGVGWAVCYQDPLTGYLANQWVEMHESGHISGFTPILVMDVWEHAFILDYAVKDRPKYIDAFLSNVDWRAVESRLSHRHEAAAA
jgi:Fe-Mn family superoxide dismutase